MKMKKILAMAVMGILALGFSSCENGDADFPDYEGGVNVYFAHQFLDRTFPFRTKYDGKLFLCCKPGIVDTYGVIF